MKGTKSNVAGLLYSRRDKATSHSCSVYVADEQGIDVGGDRYAVVCEQHGSILGVPTLLLAKRWAHRSKEFCEECRS